MSLKRNETIDTSNLVPIEQLLQQVNQTNDEKLQKEELLRTLDKVTNLNCI